MRDTTKMITQQAQKNLIGSPVLCGPYGLLCTHVRQLCFGSQLAEGEVKNIYLNAVVRRSFSLEFETRWRRECSQSDVTGRC